MKQDDRNGCFAGRSLEHYPLPFSSKFIFVFVYPGTVCKQFAFLTKSSLWNHKTQTKQKCLNQQNGLRSMIKRNKYEVGETERVKIEYDDMQSK